MSHPRAVRSLVTVGVLTLLSACGSDGGSAGSEPADGVVEIEMTDLAFSPDSVTVGAGENVTFRFVNNGAVRHEAVFGDAEFQEAHGTAMGGAGEMMDGPMPTMTDDQDHMDHGGSGGGAVAVAEPGETVEVTRGFDEPGELLIGCHEPGHYEAGMKATIRIT